MRRISSTRAEREPGRDTHCVRAEARTQLIRLPRTRAHASRCSERTTTASPTSTNCQVVFTNNCNYYLKKVNHPAPRLGPVSGHSRGRVTAIACILDARPTAVCLRVSVTKCSWPSFAQDGRRRLESGAKVAGVVVVGRAEAEIVGQEIFLARDLSYLDFEVVD